jgi:hypothetical protein
MQQVTDWLEKLGLGQYAQRFAENDISFSVLSDLTDQDLKEIGVSLGHRRQLLREIANLDKTAAASPSAPSLTPPPVATPTVAPHAEATAFLVIPFFWSASPRAAFANSERSNRAINFGGEEPTRLSLCGPYPLTITIPRSTRMKPCSGSLPSRSNTTSR